MLRTLFPPLLLTALLVAGCQARSESSNDKEPSVADRPTLEMLVQSQQALKNGRFRTALALADSASRRSPDYAGAHFQRARILAELKFYNQADSAYREALAIDAAYQGAWFNLGNNAFRKQNHREALNYYKKELQHHSSTPDLLFHVGRTYDALGKVDSAEQFYHRAVQEKPSNAAAYARLGQLYEDQGEIEKALQHSRKALDLDPDNVKYRYVVGSQLFQVGRSKEALPYLKQVTEEQPWHFSSHYNLSQALVRLGKAEEAQKYATHADSLRELQSELERLRLKAENKPGEPKLWADLGDNLRRSGRLEEALEAYERAQFLAPEDPVFRNNVALLYYQTDQPQAALAHFQAMLQRHPSFTDGWFNLGVLYARMGNTDMAQKAWQRVLQIEPDNAQARSYLAQLDSR